MKKAEMQEQEFLEVCSSYDHDLLTGKREMMFFASLFCIKLQKLFVGCCTYIL